MISLNKLLSGFKPDNAMRQRQKVLKEMNKYVTCSTPWDVSKGAVKYAQQLDDIKEMVYNFAKHNNVHVDMFIPKEEFEVVNISVNKLGKKAKKSDRVSELLHLQSGLVPMEKANTRMLEDKDGLNYISHGKLTREDNFIKQVYHTVASLVNKLNGVNK